MAADGASEVSTAVHAFVPDLLQNQIWPLWRSNIPCPEHAYPAAIDSCTDAVIFAFDNAERYGFDTDNISLGGDSSEATLR